jgi:hypothetical protein
MIRWVIAVGAVLLPVGAAIQSRYTMDDGDVFAVGMSVVILGGCGLLAGALVVAYHAASAGVIVAQPRRVEVGDRLRVDRHDFPLTEVRRVELHRERVPDYGDRFTIAVIGRRQVVELVFDDGDEAAAVAADLRERLPGADDYATRARPMFRRYSVVTLLVAIVAAFAICGAPVLSVVMQGPIGAWLGAAATAAVALATYAISRWTTKSMTAGYIRTEYGLDG